MRIFGAVFWGRGKRGFSLEMGPKWMGDEGGLGGFSFFSFFWWTSGGGGDVCVCVSGVFFHFLLVVVGSDEVIDWP
jgi:hypothetical protein